MSSPEFSVAARDLDASGKRFRFAVRASWIRGALEGTDVSAPDADGELDVRLSKSGTDVVIRGAVAADLEVPCARCLEPARVVVREPVSALAVPAAVTEREGHSADPEGDSLAAAESDVIPYDGETVVLDDLVRDELLLGIPMIPLCSESCAGIRPQPSGDAEGSGMDPRLQPLLALKSKV
jgi:uncharacterized protein